MNRLFTALLATTLLTSCSLSPSDPVPETKLPESFKEAAPEDKGNGNWAPAVSLEKEERGNWWHVFADDKLDALEKEALSYNQSLKAAEARVSQARALVRANALSFLPDFDVGANAVRAKAAGASIAAFSPGPAPNLKPYTLYSVGATASYEVDLFGRVRDTSQAFSFEADAQNALYQNMMLALTADVAQQYLSLQIVDAQRVLLKNTVDVRTEANRIMQKRFDVGSAGATDLSRTESELAAANVDLITLNRTRATLENALAILLGKNPSEYHFAELPPADQMPPVIPAGIPSSVLQRRPDIAAALATMEAANRRIGVARTAFFPSLILTATGGFEATDLSDIFKWSSRSWALGQTAGSALAMNLFDSGRNIARVDVAQAAYQESLATYRGQILTAMGDVENALSDQRMLADQASEQEKAATATTRTLDLTKKRYDQGDATYFEVVDADQGMVAANRAAIQTRGERLIATVNVIRALGGAWSEEQSKTPEIITPEVPKEETLTPLLPQEKENGVVVK